MLTQQLEVIPAIDVLEGRAVRLSEGRREAVTLEGGDPADLAREFATRGAGRLHLVDLDGAFSGAPRLELVERIAAVGALPLQVGGGYRTLDDVAAAIDAGADRVMIGTAALTPRFVDDAVERFGDGIVVAIDVRAGTVAVAGWTRSSTIRPAELALRCAASGVARLLVTGASRDGSLAGPDLELVAEVLPAGVPVMAAGGIASTGDLVLLQDAGCEAAIVGSALLAGRFTLADARAALARASSRSIREQSTGI